MENFVWVNYVWHVIHTSAHYVFDNWIHLNFGGNFHNNERESMWICILRWLVLYTQGLEAGWLQNGEWSICETIYFRKALHTHHSRKFSNRINYSFKICFDSQRNVCYIVCTQATKHTQINVYNVERRVAHITLDSKSVYCSHIISTPLPYASNYSFCVCRK